VKYGAALMLAKITGNKTYVDHVMRNFAYWIPEVAKQYGSQIPGYDGSSVRYTLEGWHG